MQSVKARIPRKNRLAVLTGASRGIGRAIALRFAEAGYHLVLNARDEEKLCALSEEIRALGGQPAEICAGDISNFQTAGRLFRTAEALSEREGLPQAVDVLINNAGIAHIGLLQDMTEEQWNEVIGVDLSAVFYTCHEVIPYMLRTHSGRIVNISSVWGVVGASCEVAYSAAKGGVNAFTAALAKELLPSGISVNAIACGAVDTSMNGQLSEEERQQLFSEIPAGRMASPEEVADFCLSLCEAGPYLSGQTIRFDGAWI